MPKGRSYGGSHYKGRPRNNASGRRCDELPSLAHLFQEGTEFSLADELPNLTQLFPEGTKFSLTGVKRDRSGTVNGNAGLVDRKKKDQEAAVARLLDGQRTGEETPKE